MDKKLITENHIIDEVEQDLEMKRQKEEEKKEKIK